MAIPVEGVFLRRSGFMTRHPGPTRMHDYLKHLGYKQHLWMNIVNYDSLINFSVYLAG